MDKRDSNIYEYFGDVDNLNDREAYNFYKKNRKKPCKAINDFQKFQRAVARMFIIISEHVVKEEEGVYIPKIGYFTNIPVSTNRVYNSLLKKKKYYKVHFFPDCELYPWTMDKTSFTEINVRVNAKRTKYKSLFNLTEAYRLSSDASIKLHNSRVDSEEYNYNPKFTYINELT